MGGDWDTSARALYPRLCVALSAAGVSVLRVRFRNSHSLTEAVHDVRVGLAFLATAGIDRLALIGHSFDGAVVIQAAVTALGARTVATLASQSYGADAIADLPPRCSVLLLHGTDDSVLPPQSSEYLYKHAHEPKRFILYVGRATHWTRSPRRYTTRFVTGCWQR